MTRHLPRLSVSLGIWQDRPAREALLTAAAADEHGFGELWIGEMATYDAFALATAVGLRTRSIGLTVGPLAVAVRDPMMLAMGAASVSDLIGRDIRLALGTSSPRVVEEWHGRDRSRSVTVLRETLTAVRVLLEGRAGDGSGTMVRTRGYRLRLPPPGPHLTIAGFGPGALRLGATSADRVVLSLVTVDEAAALAAQVRQAAEQADQKPPAIAAWVPVAVGDEEPAMSQLRSMLVAYLAAPGYAAMFEREGFSDLVEYARSRPHPRSLLDRIPDTLLLRVAALGSAQTVRRRLEDYAEHVDEVACIPCSTESDPAGMHTLATLAALAGAAPADRGSQPPLP
jgi:probable F420-dependent oxidoreductase